MTKFTTVKIMSSNPDIQGIWRKSEIESDMIDIYGVVGTDTSWLDWLYMHLFADEGYDSSQVDFIYKFMMNPNTLELKIMLDNDLTRIIKS